MVLKFWGVRGSLPVPGIDTLEIGGNTTCVSIEHEDFVFVFDAGTGIKQLGTYLESEQHTHLKGSIFLSHYHWDHIQGLPFFGPAFRNENRFHLYGEQKKGTDLFEILTEQMQPPYFPVDMDAQVGLVTFNDIEPNQVIEVAAGIKVSCMRLSHPGGALGFRLDSANCSVCIITDHEHADDGPDDAVIEFARGATVLVHEAPYDPEEKQNSKKGWGHSSWMEAALVAQKAGVGRLFLSHHDPDKTDDQLRDLIPLVRAVFPASEIATERTTVSVENAA